MAKRYSSVEKQGFLVEFKERKISQREFCREKNLTQSTFSKWCQEWQNKNSENQKLHPSWIKISSKNSYEVGANNCTDTKTNIGPLPQTAKTNNLPHQTLTLIAIEIGKYKIIIPENFCLEILQSVVKILVEIC